MIKSQDFTEARLNDSCHIPGFKESMQKITGECTEQVKFEFQIIISYFFQIIAALPAWKTIDTGRSRDEPEVYGYPESTVVDSNSQDVSSV